jgi:hypothetical protein
LSFGGKLWRPPLSKDDFLGHTPVTGNDLSGSRIGLDASLQALLKNLDL